MLCVYLQHAFAVCARKHTEGAAADKYVARAQLDVEDVSEPRLTDSLKQCASFDIPEKSCLIAVYEESGEDETKG